MPSTLKHEIVVFGGVQRDFVLKTGTSSALDCDAQGVPVHWVRRMKLAIGRLSPRFSTDRMVREYTEQYYHPLSRPEGVPAAAD